MTNEVAAGEPADEVFADDARQKNAETIAQHLNGEPDGHTVEDIARDTGLDEGEIRVILDEWRPSPDDTVEHLGPGRGGPWIQ